MQPLADNDAGNFDRAAPNTGIGKQHCPQGFRAQPGQPTTATAQGLCWNQGTGEYPGPLVAQQMDLAGPYPATCAQIQHTRFVAAGTSPGLTENADAESARAGAAQASSQRSDIQEPSRQVGGHAAQEQTRAGMPVWRSVGRGRSVGVQDSRCKYIRLGRRMNYGMVVSSRGNSVSARCQEPMQPSTRFLPAPTIGMRITEWRFVHVEFSSRLFHCYQ